MEDLKATNRRLMTREEFENRYGVFDAKTETNLLDDAAKRRYQYPNNRAGRRRFERQERLEAKHQPKQGDKS